MALTKIQGDMVKSAAMYGVVGCDCKNNSSTPNTQFDMDADLITMIASDGSSVVRVAPGAAITNNIATAGPAANGRDQGDAFTHSTFVHFYWIWNGTTLATLSSGTYSPTGVTLPTGYTHYAYACSVYLNSSSELRRVYVKGSTVFHAGQVTALVDGRATSETAVDLSAVVPSASPAFFAHHSGAVRYGTNEYQLRVLTAVDYWDQTGNSEAASIRRFASGWFPNVGQQIFYVWGSDPGESNGIALFIQAYKVPNGGE